MGLALALRRRRPAAGLFLWAFALPPLTYPAHGLLMGEWLRNDAATISNYWSEIPNVDGYTWGLQTLPTQDTAGRQPTVPDFDISWEIFLTIPQNC